LAAGEADAAFGDGLCVGMGMFNAGEFLGAVT
jgi:hypothetical protein